MKYCSYCGKEIMDEAVICPHCGRQVASLKGKGATADFSDILRNKKVLAVLIVCLAVAAGVFVSRNVLWGDDKAAYDIMVACADNFKNPASLRLMSGSLSTDKDSMYVKTCAQNGFGTDTIGYYLFTAEGKALGNNDLVYNNMSKFQWIYDLYTADDLNVDKINRIYARNHGRPDPQQQIERHGDNKEKSPVRQSGAGGKTIKRQKSQEVVRKAMREQSAVPAGTFRHEGAA